MKYEGPILSGRKDGAFRREWLGSLDGHGLQPGVQAALVARGGVVVQNALLHALIEQGNRPVVLGTCGGGIVRGQRFAHGAQATAQLAAVGAVDGGALDGLPGALQRRNMVCH